jgi:hypothetical protein
MNLKQGAVACLKVVYKYSHEWAEGDSEKFIRVAAKLPRHWNLCCNMNGSQ